LNSSITTNPSLVYALSASLNVSLTSNPPPSRPNQSFVEQILVPANALVTKLRPLPYNLVVGRVRSSLNWSKNRGTFSHIFNIDSKKKKPTLNRNLKNESKKIGLEIIDFDHDGEIRSLEECTKRLVYNEFMDATLVFSKRLRKWKRKPKLKRNHVDCDNSVICNGINGWFEEWWGWEAKEQKNKLERNTIWDWKTCWLHLVFLHIWVTIVVFVGFIEMCWWWWWKRTMVLVVEGKIKGV